MALPVVAFFIWAGLTAWGVRAVEAEMEFVSIPAGCFQMGSPDTDAERYPNEVPVHEVCPIAFTLGKFEVTQQQWRQVMVHNPSQFNDDELRPVESVSRDEAQSFLFWMNFFGRHYYRLPSEAEWEYAARAGTKTSRYWGDRAEDGCTYENVADLTLKKALPDQVVANCDDHNTVPTSVGSFQANPWGLYDILGNVAEWVQDCYVANYQQAATDGRTTTTENCSVLVVRGGSWLNNPRMVRAASRINVGSGIRGNYIGFRVARTVTP